MAFRPDGFGDARIEQLRVPPQSIEAEQAVLGGLMLAPDAFDRVADWLNEEDFYRRDHQLIYRAIRELAEKNRPYDAVTLGEWFDSNGLTEQVAGGAYLIELASTTPSAANIGAYAEIVRDKSILRQLIEAGTGIVNDAFQPDGRESAEILQAAEQAISALSEGRDSSEPVGINQSLKEAFAEIEELYSRGGGITGVPTGYAEFDELTAGLQPTDLIILAARPAMGKTTFALNIAEHAAIKSKVAVAVFSMEMSRAQLTQRLISSQGAVNASRLRTGRLDDEDWDKAAAAVRLLKECKIFIDDTPALTPGQLRAKARRLKKQHGIGLVIVDYLQLMRVAGRGENRTAEIGEISRSLKALAKELGVPVIALSQLNRSLETRTDKRPVMADLRDSGSIEQDADMVVFIYRDEYYNKENSPDRGRAEIIIGKQRKGPTGNFKLLFSGEYSRFREIPDRWCPPEPEKPVVQQEGRPRGGFGRARRDTAAAAAGDRG